MKDHDHYSFDVKTHYASGTNHARCNGYTASSTNNPRRAAEAAAQKAFSSMCLTLAMKPGNYLRGSVPLAGGVFQVNFTREP